MALVGVIIACKDGAMCDKLAHTLSASGIDVVGTATKGASALQKAARYYGERGVLLCSYALSDMNASELYRIMPEGFEMVVLLSARQRAVFDGEGMLCLDIPINRRDLIDTLMMLTETHKPVVVKPDSRSEGDREIISRAKALLMERNGMSEPEAHRFLQKQSMNSGQSLVCVAMNILNGVF